MFRSFTVSNFRCFRELTLEPLQRINLIAGKNNTGKTALLEAIHLHSYPRDCAVPFAVSERRGTDSEKKFDEDRCAWLFFDKDAASGFELSSKSDNGEERTLQMWLLDHQKAELKFPALALEMRRQISPSIDPGGRCVILDMKTSEREIISLGFSQGGRFLSANSVSSPWNGPSVFIGSSGLSLEEDARAFSDVEGANRQDEIVPSLQLLEPRLERLSILLLAGQPVIHGHIGLSRLVPMQFMGEGIRRLLSILLAINQAKGGNVLIDEVENGLHHSVMVPVWQAIAEAARQADVQVFATTHSYECIQAAQQAFQPQDAEVLRLFRLDRIQDQIRVVEYDPETLNYAIDMTHEVR